MNVIDELAVVSGIPRERFAVGQKHCDVCVYGAKSDAFASISKYVSHCEERGGYINMDVKDEYILRDLHAAIGEDTGARADADVSEDSFFLDRRTAFIHYSRTCGKISLPECPCDRKELLRVLYDESFDVEKIKLNARACMPCATARAALFRYYAEAVSKTEL